MVAREGAVLIHDMRNCSFQLLTVLGSILVATLSGCASHDETLQSRIERDINNPDSGNIHLGTSYYNQHAQEFEQAWPFGPLSTR
jgi:hypothetical protein